MTLYDGVVRSGFGKDHTLATQAVRTPVTGGEVQCMTRKTTLAITILDFSCLYTAIHV